MERFRADLHIHSRYSRATSKALTPRHLSAWALAKGLEVIGTGDFTHPKWLEEIAESCVDDGSGLLTLRSPKGLSSEIPHLDGWLPQGRTRFVLQAEISSIYKRGGRVRKVHNLVFVPSLDKARELNARLSAIGNLASDGRPILGLDSKNLLEMVLELGGMSFLVPAHIWTPWFSLFGSASGFDSMEECFGDLSSEIFALETGLSSDPDMNRLISGLDRFRLISNSDAHSGEKLGREANIFSGEMTYETIYRSLKGEGLGQGFLGTYEFFPEEGKYHLDGHRKCGVVLEPRDAMARGNICPVCGKPLTLGVLHRVMELADREAPENPQGQPAFSSLIPLSEVCGEVIGAGPGTKKSQALYTKAVSRFGSEMGVLCDVPPEDLSRVHPLLGEAVGRMRQGRVLRDPGFDGQFGVISVFSQAEKQEMRQGRFLATGLSGGLLPGAEARPAQSAQASGEKADTARSEIAPAGAAPAPGKSGADADAAPLTVFQPARPAAPAWNEAQQQAMAAGPHPVLVLAGPGTGKTQTLMGRAEALMAAGTPASEILAVTFTRRAAAEMRERLARGKEEGTALPRADTLHALAFEYWAGAYAEAPTVMDEDSARRVFAECMPELSGARLKQAFAGYMLAREQRAVDDAMRETFRPYVKKKEYWNLVDYADLLEFWLEQIESGIYVRRHRHLLVDEVQDLSALQLAVVKALAGPEGTGLFAIGDPDQSIYSFRGALPAVEADLRAAWPNLEVVRLTENYRSAPPVLTLSAALFPGRAPLRAHLSEPGEQLIFTAPDAAREAAWIGERVRALLGGSSATLDGGRGGGLSPGEIAILVRFKALAGPIRRTLERLGLPCSVPEAEAFWLEPRIAAIMATAKGFLGMTVPDEVALQTAGLAAEPTDEGAAEEPEPLSVPEKVLAKGPLGLAAYFQDLKPFDRMFWNGRPFKEFSRAFEVQGGWAGLVNWVDLQSATEQVRQKAERVQIMTLHAAKGLEFGAVFLPALEDGLLPFAGMGFLSGKASDERPDEAEERRLFYVGLTRSRGRLYLSRAQSRMLYGRELRLPASRFLEALPQELLRASVMVPKTVRQERQIQLM
ncbi:UvrD-like DNA helicase [Desulfovibrio sp. X2]|uniref:UvrD-helicase domain-containing protein n=1 Tax=Desulfovibrio sp. X2 TaxID=941449 RepID=UPI00035892E3|nr:UvrD-helicase domain-containing protein [Desulfovibrio sp. X2]EPR43727.1 UvrD-like DNA helicase [Desulfovibrio sp. X2]